MFYKIIKFLFLLFFATNVMAQNDKLTYSKKISISNGLAHNGVTSIIEDSKGYIWFGTYDGLNRYDGYDFSVFKNSVDKEVLINNRIRTLAEDKKGNLWVGTDEGISIYNYTKEKFTTLFSNSLLKKGITGPIIRKVLFNDAKKIVLCITERKGILIFNEDYSFNHQYFPKFKELNANVSFFDGIALDTDNYIFSTSVGLISFNLSTKTYKKVVPASITFSKSILKLTPNKILVTLNKGIAILNYKTSKKSSIFTISHFDLKNYEFVTSALDRFNNLWLGTAKEGFIRVNNASLVINKSKYTIADFNISPSLLRMSCFVPLKNSCWVGSFNKGIYKFELNENPFKHYNKSKNQAHGLTSNEVFSISPIDDNRVYVSTIQGGLSLFNTKTNQFESLPFKITTSDLNLIGASYVDSRKNLWFKIDGKGLFRVRHNATTYELVYHSKDHIFNNDAIKLIVEDANGNILVGGTDDLYKFNLDNSQNVISVEKINDNPFFKENKISLVRYIYPDPIYKNLLWIGTNADGLFRIDFSKNKLLTKAKIDRYTNDKSDKKSISSSFITSILRLPNKELWLGTERGGICKVINSTTEPSFVSFSEKQGLSNNVVKSIIYDGNNSLWITTNIGLNKFNINEHRFLKFTVSDGLPFEDFNYGVAKLRNGLIVMGGFDGFCYFDPKDLPSTEKLPRLEFGELKVFNSSIKAGDTLNDRIVMNKRLSDLNELELDYNENVFSIGVTSLHFSTQSNHFIKYQLSPINKEWIEIPSDQRNIYFNGLPPGDYVLKVKASNTLNRWTKTKEIKITINPPFWKTSWAYIFYYLLIIVGGYFFLHFILRMQRLNHNIQIEELEKNNIKEINAAKLRFFSNISHEIKTPLTLISGPIDTLYETLKGNDEVGNMLKIVQKQSRKIAKLIDQVHDFQKADANLLKMNYSYFSFDDFITELISEYQFLAKMDYKILEASGAGDNIYVYADKDKLEKIFNNLLTNAFKYTKQNDTIRIEYHADENDLIILVKDKGKGIDQEDLPYVFDRFYQSKKKENIYHGGSGIGLAFSKQLVEMHYGYIGAESEVGEGTTIHVRLPIIHTEYTEDQEEIENEVLSAEKLVKHSFSFSNIDNKSLKFDPNFSESKIFIAEDNSDLRNYISTTLSNFMDIEVFVNGKECLDALDNNWPDLILSDVLMPELNGFDLCKRIKSDIKTSHIPVVLLTACTTIDEQVKGLIDGADAYIQKPFNMQYLISTIESILRNRKQLRERFQIELPLTLTTKDNSNDNVFLEKLYSLMAENLDNQELDLDHFAKDLYLNRTHFYQKVKTLTNYTPFELLKIYRLKKAAEFLVEGKLSVNEVYMMTGFKSRTHFSKLFKEKYEVTPGKYASEMVNKYSDKTN
ncbi:hybrid sensor histidine kinase/response regulator transcription factor [Flavobacterium sp. 7A]|uniref:hybrid sensor histidine kinase/response regulator transcription factor n=1 Tax=Flavobacterium sp. 7A TaxID=2940571 RepID=UPI0022274709|nr:hybrid sensor histidine kinase/response regulator transcription factor [Flavobacterium sp. 7A]MCW2119029.1 signal transduction histidine kinase/ligand-binding sensor domain-containing protein/DNA-binding response OmpR family regulator [Flavobacterium sp. 7A]